MIGDDLAGVLAPKPGPEPFRQGVIVAWDAATGANTINVGGALLVNLPVLNISDAVNLAIGDAVVVARMSGSWCVLGRVILPNSPSLHRANSYTDTASDTETNFSVNTTVTTKCDADLTTPAWANACIAHVTGNVTVRNSTASASFLNMGFLVQGVGGATNFAPAPAAGAVGFDGWTHLTLTQVIRKTGLTAGQLVDVDLRLWTTTGAWAAHVSNLAYLSVLGIFYRA